MSEYLFAYGTLQPGHAPPDVAHIVSRFKLIGEGFVNGALYDLGDYPGAVLDASSQQNIAGTVFELPADPLLLSEIDAYEVYDPAAPDASLFLRVMHPVALATGGSLPCWVYVWNGNPATAPIIPGGRFHLR